jgi:putative transposase
MGSIMPLVVEVVTMERGHFSWQRGELIAKIEPFVVAYNTTKAPFNWTATADSILEKLKQLCAQISRTAN